MDVPRFHPLAELFPLIEGKEFDELVADIKANGLREAIMLDAADDGQIIDGRNRYRACEAAAAAMRFEILPPGTDLRAFVISKNLHRRHLNESQRAMVAARLADMPTGRPEDNSANLQTSQAQAASLVNVSTRSVASAKALQESGTPELIHAVDQGKLAVSAGAQAAKLSPEQQRKIVDEAEAGRPNAARTVIKQESRSVREAELGAKQIALPDAKYGVVLADPEWRFEPYSRETGMDRAADNHYTTSATEVIASRPVATIAADDCVLFLWATAPMIQAALLVMEAWGFAYKSQAIWRKDRQGTGYWFRNEHELLLVGTRGKIPAPAMGTQWGSVIEAPVAAHSEKPDAFYLMMETYFPTLPKIELNARRRRDGWESWGFEAPKIESVPATEGVLGHEADANDPDRRNEGGSHVTDEKDSASNTSVATGTGEGARPGDPVPDRDESESQAKADSEAPATQDAAASAEAESVSRLADGRTSVSSSSEIDGPDALRGASVNSGSASPSSQLAPSASVGLRASAQPEGGRSEDSRPVPTVPLADELHTVSEEFADSAPNRQAAIAKLREALTKTAPPQDDAADLPDFLERVELTRLEILTLTRIRTEDCDRDETAFVIKLRRHMAAATVADRTRLAALAKSQGLTTEQVL